LAKKGSAGAIQCVVRAAANEYLLRVKAVQICELLLELVDLGIATQNVVFKVLGKLRKKPDGLGAFVAIQAKLDWSWVSLDAIGAKCFDVGGGGKCHWLLLKQ
jgi:hypothetical protein